MRSSHLFVVLIGVMPLLAFGTTVWLTDGAPFVPFGDNAVQDGASEDAEAPATLRPQPAQGPTDVAGIAPMTAGFAAGGTPGDTPGAAPDPAASNGDDDADWVGLRRRARAGDADAALLLVILDEPPNYRP